MIEEGVLTTYVDSLEQEIRRLCPQSEVLFKLLYEMKKKLAEAPSPLDKKPFLDLVNQFEEVLDVEVFWT